MKKMISGVVLATAVVLVGWMPVASSRPTAFSSQSAPVVETETFVSVDKLQPGASAKVAVRLTIDESYHINANPPTEEFMIPTRLEFPLSADFKVGAVAYPTSQLRKVSFSEKELAVYEGVVVVMVPLTAAKTLAPGKHVLAGKLIYQACTDEACLPPKKLTLEIPIEVAPPGTPSHPTHPELFAEKAKGR